MKTLEQKQKDYNWYYTQVFVRPIPGSDAEKASIYSRTILFVTFAQTPTTAKELATDYVSQNAPEGYELEGQQDIHLYQKNYIRQSRVLVSAGKYAGVNPLA